MAQVNVSGNARKGTLRGMHYQLAPRQEAKVVSCMRGAIYDVALDLRRDSPTYLKWVAAELTAENRRMLYIPEGCALRFPNPHGRYRAAVFDVRVLFPRSCPRAARCDDPAFGIEWPLAVTCMSDTDRAWPDYQKSLK